ncbi:MAG: hypothetical protein HQK88_07930 [Nitrospirae bacterium]|nr:hypothetical protein [Nitrospirota bacterium]MBF0533618.1 hypothetical protein [Nitrospirota bacterium]MBF0616731.1 hypothetical protein [Nitrospirota bacterium]
MKKWVLVFFFIAYAMMVIVPAYGEDAPRLTIDELKAKLGSPDVVVIDVRVQGAYNNSKMKIKGAVRENPALFGQWSQKYPKDKTLVLYCT